MGRPGQIQKVTEGKGGGGSLGKIHIVIGSILVSPASMLVCNTDCLGVLLGLGVLLYPGLERREP